MKRCQYGPGLVIALCVLTSCQVIGFPSDFTEEDGLLADSIDTSGFMIESSQASYIARDDLVVVEFVILNRGTVPFYLISCPATISGQLQKLVDGEWVPAHSRACIERRGARRVSPGEQKEYILLLHPSLVKRPSGWFVDEFEGTYRAVERISLEWNYEAYITGKLASTDLHSNEFTLSQQ